jgi:hypothetical protein
MEIPEIDFDFDAAYAGIDQVIMSALGDDITLSAPANAVVITTKCVLSAEPGSIDGYVWKNNIEAKIDVSSTIIEVLESDAPGIGKNWTAVYFGKTYVVTEVLPKGDGTLTVIMNEPGNSAYTAEGWR